MALKAQHRRAYAKALMVGGFFVCVAMLTYLSFISLPLAGGAFALMSFAVAGLYERMQRQLWEQAVDFKIKLTEEKQEALADELEQQAQSVQEIQSALKRQAQTKARANLKRPVVSYESLKGAPQTAGRILKKPARAVKSFDEEHNMRATRPLRAVKGQITDPAPKSAVTDDGSGLSDMVVGELLHHALESERVDVFLQPIMRLPQRQRRFYEIFARVRAKPGVYIPAGRYKALAEENGIMRDIDALLLEQCLSVLRSTVQMDNAPPFFMNITSATLKNAAFMGPLLAFLPQNRDLVPRLVFEIQHQDFVNMAVPNLQILSGLARLGVKFSLDHVQSLDIDIPDLQRFNVRYVKAPAQMFLKAKASEAERAKIWKYKRMLEGNGIGLIVEKIESESMVRDLMDYDIHYGQGFLFGRPDVQGAYEPAFQRKAVKG